jgi:LPS sulfotransferase NodH
LRERRAFGGGSEADDLDMLREAFPGLQFVQIVRRNKVRQAISKARAAQTGLWKIQEGNVASGLAEFDPDLIASCLEDTRREEMIWQRFFERIGIQPYLVEYEDLVVNYAAAIGGVLRFLKIRVPRSSLLQPVTIRQNDALSQEWEQRFLALHPPNELLIS